MTERTISSDATPVPVADFRRLTDRLFQIVADASWCRSQADFDRLAMSVRAIGSRLIHSTCKRATAEDWLGRERAIDRSADLLATIADGSAVTDAAAYRLKLRAASARIAADRLLAENK